MEENEYLELQNLLNKLRVQTFHNLADNSLKMTERDKNVKILRAVDTLRYKVDIKTKEDKKCL